MIQTFPAGVLVRRTVFGMGTQVAGHGQRWLLDSAFTIGVVGIAALVHFALGKQFLGHTPYLISLLAVLASATRGGLYQGIFAALLSLAIELLLWGEWQWLIPNLASTEFIETLFYLIEAVLVSMLADYYLTDRLALRHSRERFQILFDSMPVGAFIHHQNKIVAANKPVVEMFGYDRQEFIGVTPLNIVAPESRREVQQRIQGRSEEAYRITGLRRDGSTFLAEVVGKTIDYHANRMRIVVVRDMTDHLIARQRLEQMNELLEARVAERTMELNQTVADLRRALENVNTLSGLLPICGSCKRIRDDDGYWSQVEDYISAHSSAEFSHSLCPECLAKLRDEIANRREE